MLFRFEVPEPGAAGIGAPGPEQEGYAPVALQLVGLVLGLLALALRCGMAGGSLWDRAWWASALVLVALHATDMPFYDSRINVAGWVLLAGLRVYR